MILGTQPTIVASSITMRYGKKTVFSHLDCTARPSEITALTGPSGCGKTTLMHIMAGLLSPTSGNVNAPTRKERGFIFQDYNLIESLNSLDNALLSARLLGKRASRSKATQLLEELGLGSVVKQFPHQLSGGQKQRIAIARAMLAEVPYIFADEPTGALDEANSTLVMKQLQAAAGRGATVILITHDPQVLECADRTTRVGEFA